MGRFPYFITQFLQVVMPPIVWDAKKQKQKSPPPPPTPESPLESITTIPQQPFIQSVNAFASAMPKADIVAYPPLLPAPSTKSYLAIPDPQNDPYASSSRTSYFTSHDVPSVFERYTLPTIHYLMRTRAFSTHPRWKLDQWANAREHDAVENKEQTQGITEMDVRKAMWKEGKRWKYSWKPIVIDNPVSATFPETHKGTNEMDMFGYLWTIADTPAQVAEANGQVLLVVCAPWVWKSKDFQDLVSPRLLEDSKPEHTPKRILRHPTAPLQGSGLLPTPDASPRLVTPPPSRESMIDSYLHRITNACEETKTRHVILTSQNLWSFGAFPVITDGIIDFTTIQFTPAMPYTSSPDLSVSNNESQNPAAVVATAKIDPLPSSWDVGVLPAAMYWISEGMKAGSTPRLAVVKVEEPEEVVQAAALSRKRSREVVAEEDGAETEIEEPQSQPSPSKKLRRSNRLLASASAPNLAPVAKRSNAKKEKAKPTRKAAPKKSARKVVAPPPAPLVATASFTIGTRRSTRIAAAGPGPSTTASRKRVRKEEDDDDVAVKADAVLPSPSKRARQASWSDTDSDWEPPSRAMSPLPLPTEKPVPRKPVAMKSKARTAIPKALSVKPQIPPMKARTRWIPPPPPATYAPSPSPESQEQPELATASEQSEEDDPFWQVPKSPFTPPADSGSGSGGVNLALTDPKFMGSMLNPKMVREREVARAIMTWR